MSLSKESAEGFHNIRTPLLDENPVRYRVTRFAPRNADPNAGEINLTPAEQFVLDWSCGEEVSAFDNQPRRCPAVSE